MFTRLLTGILMLSLTVVASGQMHGMRNGIPTAHNLPPAQQLLEPGPGVGGPGPGVMTASHSMGASGGPANMAAYGPFGAVTQQSVQILFGEPELMQVRWDVTSVGRYDSVPLVVPGRQNFAQGGVYRLKITNIEGRPGLELYPTLEIGAASPRTAAYLAHSAIPVQMTDEDFDQITAGNYVTKVIYVPDAEYQELALAGVDTLVSTRLDPGVDPIVEADRRGAILAVVRCGNKDLEVAGVDPSVAAGAMIGPSGVGRVGMDAYVSGVTGPNYGMPNTGTSIGLPGPPHIPMGGPAGLRNYTMHNHTAMQIPGPTPKVNVHVRQKPGLSYPRPADRVLIQEQTIRPPHFNSQPPADMVYGNVPFPPGCNGSCGGGRCGGTCGLRR